MVTTVVVINLLIALLNLYLAWHLWHLRRVLAGAADAILMADRNTYDVLHEAPQAILLGQIGTKTAREQYQQLEMQLQKLRQVLSLLGLGQQLWRRQTQQVRQSKLKKKAGSRYR